MLSGSVSSEKLVVKNDSEVSDSQRMIHDLKKISWPRNSPHLLVFINPTNELCPEPISSEAFFIL